MNSGNNSKACRLLKFIKNAEKSIQEEAVLLQLVNEEVRAVEQIHHRQRFLL